MGQPRTLTIQKHLIANQSFLESGAHERISSARLGENGEVHVEEHEIENNGHSYQSYCSGKEVSPKVVLK